ncbi:MAG: hypothetical protein V7L26_05095 [Nostoc sp.]|uniref:hypothetical protein n=1 Tax=Nostoc sp. TaxID=1180 RepID=UPI002FEF345A
MGKPIGHWTNFSPGDGSLLSEMEQAWGSHFEKLNEAERAWMIYQLGYQLWQDAEESVSDGVENVIQQAQNQVSNIDKLGLIQALVELSKGG